MFDPDFPDNVRIIPDDELQSLPITEDPGELTKTQQEVLQRQIEDEKVNGHPAFEVRDQT